MPADFPKPVDQPPPVQPPAQDPRFQPPANVPQGRAPQHPPQSNLPQAFCMTCGAALKPNNKFCSRCGQPISLVPPDIPPPPNFQQLWQDPRQAQYPQPWQDPRQAHRPQEPRAEENQSGFSLPPEQPRQAPANITIELPGHVLQREGFPLRFVAALIDGVILTVLVVGSGLIFNLVWLPVLLTSAYYFIEVLLGFTPGKRVLNLMVLNEETPVAQAANPWQPASAPPPPPPTQMMTVSFNALSQRWRLKVGIVAACNFLIIVAGQFNAPEPVKWLLQLPSLVVVLASLTIFGASLQTFYDKMSKTAVFKVDFLKGVAGSSDIAENSRKAKGIVRTLIANFIAFFKTNSGIFDKDGKFSLKGLLLFPFRLIKARFKSFLIGFIIGTIIHFLAVSLNGGFQDVASFPNSLLLPTRSSLYFPIASAVWMTIAMLISYFRTQRRSGAVQPQRNALSMILLWMCGIGWYLLTAKYGLADDGGLNEFATNPSDFVNQGGVDLLGQSGGLGGVPTGIGNALGNSMGGRPPGKPDAPYPPVKPDFPYPPPYEEPAPEAPPVVEPSPTYSPEPSYTPSPEPSYWPSPEPSYAPSDEPSLASDAPEASSAAPSPEASDSSQPGDSSADSETSSASQDSDSSASDSSLSSASDDSLSSSSDSSDSLSSDSSDSSSSDSDASDSSSSESDESDSSSSDSDASASSSDSDSSDSSAQSSESSDSESSESSSSSPEPILQITNLTVMPTFIKKGYDDPVWGPTNYFSFAVRIDYINNTGDDAWIHGDIYTGGSGADTEQLEARAVLQHSASSHWSYYLGKGQPVSFTYTIYGSNNLRGNTVTWSWRSGDPVPRPSSSPDDDDKKQPPSSSLVPEEPDSSTSPYDDSSADTGSDSPSMEPSPSPSPEPESPSPSPQPSPSPSGAVVVPPPDSSPDTGSGSPSAEASSSSPDNPIDENELRRNIIRGMNRANQTIGYDGYLDSNFWNKDGWVKWSLKPGVKPSDAIEAIFRDGSGSKMECLSAISAIYYKSILDTIGPEKFNKLFKNGLEVSTESPIFDYFRTKSPTEPLKAGDWCYIQGHPDYHSEDFTKAFGKHVGAWQGENAIYVGNGRYSGLGLTNMTEAEMKAEMLNHYNQKVDAYNQTPYGRLHPKSHATINEIVGLRRDNIQAPAV